MAGHPHRRGRDPGWIRYKKADRDEAVSSQATRTKPGLAGEREEAEKARAIELASGVQLGRGARNRGGFVPGSYAAANAALSGADARAVQLRAMKKAAEDKDKDRDEDRDDAKDKDKDKAKEEDKAAAPAGGGGRRRRGG